MQAQQLGVYAGRHAFSLLLFNNNYFTPCISSSRIAPNYLRLHITHLRHRLQLSAELQGNVADSSAGLKLVKVKFVLQRRCEFGQQFFVVGDDELVGAWNPEAALPMQWSEGHVWTTELEVSTCKRIEYKLILVGVEGVLEWQQGPNRVLETMESLTPLVVLQTWTGEDQDDALDMPELSDIKFLSNSIMNVGGAELPIPLLDSETVYENIETTVDGALSEQSVLGPEKQTLSLSSEPSVLKKDLQWGHEVSMDMAQELSVFEKDLRWTREALSTLWDKFMKE